MDLQLSVTEVCPTCKAKFTKPDLEKHLEGGCLVKPKAKPLVRCYNGKATQSVSSNLCMICGNNFGNVSDFLKHVRTGCTFPMIMVSYTRIPKVNNKSKDSKKDSKVSNKSKNLNNLSVSIKKEKKDNSYVRQDAVNMDVVKTEIVDTEISDVMIETMRMSDAKIEVTGIKSIEYETVESVKVRKKTNDVENMVIDAGDSTEKMDIPDGKIEIVDKEICTVTNETPYVSDKKLEVTDMNSVGNEILESTDVRNKTDELINMVIDASYSTEKMDMFVVKTEVIDKEICDVMNKNNSMKNTDLEVTEINLVENETLERKTTFDTSKIITGASYVLENICKVASEDMEEQGNQAKPVKKKPKKNFHICRICWEEFNNILDFHEHIRIGCSYTRIKISDNDHVVVSKNSCFQKEANKFHKSSTDIADINATNQINPQVNNDVKHLQALSDLVVIEKVDGSDHKVKKEDMTDTSPEVVDSLDVRSDYVDINNAYCTDTISVSNETSYTHDVRKETGMTDGILVGTASTEKVCRIATSNLKETDKKGAPCEFDHCEKVFDEANVIMVKPKRNYVSFNCSVCDKKISNGIALKKHLLWHKKINPRSLGKEGEEANTKICWEEFDDILDVREHIRKSCFYTRIKISKNNHVGVSKNSVFQKEVNKFHKSSTSIADINATNQIHPQVNNDVKHLQTLSDLVVIEKVDGSDHKVKKEYSHFRCDTCNNLFTTYTHLEEHIQVHVGHKRYM